MSDRYKVKYTVEPGDFPKELADKDPSIGLADYILLASVLYGEDGSSSTLFLTRDGRTGEAMTDEDKFKIWILLGDELSESASLPESSRELAGRPFRLVQKGILEAIRREEMEGK